MKCSNCGYEEEVKPASALPWSAQKDSDDNVRIFDSRGDKICYISGTETTSHEDYLNVQAIVTAVNAYYGKKEGE